MNTGRRVWDIEIKSAKGETHSFNATNFSLIHSVESVHVRVNDFQILNTLLVNPMCLQLCIIIVITIHSHKSICWYNLRLPLT